jgi:hypothetical protein
MRPFYFIFNQPKLNTMELTLQRFQRTDNSTISKLFIENEMECFCIEDKDRGLTQDMTPLEIRALKIHSKTAIPYGRYQISITFSNRFKKPLPLIMGVTGFEGIRIHPGNTAEDSSGCLLCGTSYDIDRVNNSREAFYELFEKLEKANKTEKIFITIK